jgi:hypothetical protein
MSRLELFETFLACSAVETIDQKLTVLLLGLRSLQLTAAKRQLQRNNRRFGTEPIRRPEPTKPGNVTMQTMGVTGLTATRLKPAQPDAVAIMLMCAAKLIRSTTRSDIVPSLSCEDSYIPGAFEQRGVRQQGGLS